MKGDSMEGDNKRGIGVLNTILLIFLLIVTFSLFSSSTDFLYFIGYFLMLFIGGFGFLLLLKDFTKNPIIYFIISLLAGITFNGVLFILLNFLNLNQKFSPFILLFVGLTFMIFNFKKARSKFSNIKILKDPHLFLIIILIIFTLFVFSDRITYTNEGVYLHDSTHPVYELSLAQGLKTMFPAELLSYQGRESKYHFGFSIIVYQLANNLDIDGLDLIYLLFPALFTVLLFFLLYEYSKSFIQSTKKALYCWLILFSTLSIPTRPIIEVINTIFKTSIVSVDGPFFLFHQFLKMGSFTMSIIITIALFIVIAAVKRNYTVEAILLLGLAMAKTPFFIAVAPGYSFIFFLQLISGKNWKKYESWKRFLQRNLIFIPGVLFILLFVVGTHKHNLWVLFVSSFNGRSTSLSQNLLIPNAALSLLLALVITIGIGFIYLWPTIKVLLRKSSLIQKIKDNDKNLAYILIIISSYLFGILIFEVVDGNHDQFLFPGYIFLSLLTYKYIFTSENLKKLGKIKKWLVAFFVVIVLVNSLFAGLFFVLPTVKQPFSYEDSSNNFLANLKLRTLQSVIPRPGGLSPDCHHSNDLIDGLKVLSKEDGDSGGVFLMNPLHQNCDNYEVSSWKDIIMSKDGGFIRTAVSGKQTLAEGYSLKGVVGGSDYCSRIYESILFYSIVSGEENKIKEHLPLFSNNRIAYYEDFSYYTYFKKFSAENFFTYNQGFVECITEKIQATNTGELDQNLLKEFITKNKIAYIIFEKGQSPLEEYRKSLGLSLIYSSDSVKVFKVNVREADVRKDIASSGSLADSGYPLRVFPG